MRLPIISVNPNIPFLSSPEKFVEGIHENLLKCLNQGYERGFQKLKDFLKTFEKDVIYIVVDPALRFREMGR